MPETEAHPKLKLKLKLLKAKLLAPHIAAKIAVAKKIKAKTAIAAAKTFDAVSFSLSLKQLPVKSHLLNLFSAHFSSKQRKPLH